MTTENNASFEGIAALIRSSETFLVLGHLRPDGDAIGSQLALAICIERLGKSVAVWNQDAVPEKLRFLPESGRVLLPPADRQDFDVVFALDTSTKVRLGTCLDSLGTVGTMVNIDHHGTNVGYGDLNYIDSDSPATGQILYELIRSQQLPYSYEVADNLFAAISTDTGSFQYPGTTARTFEIGAELIASGVDVGKLSEHIYESYPLRRVELLRSLLNSLELSEGNRVAVILLTQDEANRIGSKPEDTEGLIDHIRSIDSVEVAAFIEETEDGTCRVSMRSKSDSANVAEICAELGGGGHPLAAGARVSMPPEETKTAVLATIRAAMKRDADKAN